MKVRKTLLVAAAWAGLAAQAVAQLPGASLPIPPVAAPLGTPLAAPPPAAAPPTLWQKLGIGKDQRAACKQQFCATQFGQLVSNGITPITAISGGLIQPCCANLMPTAAQLADPGAEGAAAAIMADEAGAKARRAAVRYLGTVDCHYWPEAGDALINSLRADHNECVRWEAALALGRGCCCTKKTIEALCIVVGCSDRDGNPKETSYRVHAAAAAALEHCLCCYANVTTAPAPAADPEKPTEKATPPTETIPPPQTPQTPPAPDKAVALPANPSDVKPAPGVTPAATPAVAQRPVGPAYYARIAKAPLVQILAEARRVSEKNKATPVATDTPLQPGHQSVAVLMSYATGPDTQQVIPAGMSVPPSEVRAEVVSARPSNVWDLLAKPEIEGQGVIVKPETVVVAQPAPKPVVVKRETVVRKPEVVVKRDPVATKADPVVTKPALVLAPPPAPMPKSMPMPKGESLTLDFPPPAPMPMDAPVTGPSPYYATAATPTKASRPSESAGSAVSSYYPTAATPSAKSLPTETPNSAVSSYFPTAATPTAKSLPTEAPNSAVSSYHPTAATAVSPTAVVKSNSSSPYNGAVTAQSKPTPAPIAKAAPAQLPTPVMMPATPLSTKPMPAPAAPVVPAATVPMAVPAMPASSETVEHLLMTAKGTGPVEVRKASIQELARMKVNSPEVMVALDGLADDPTPGVRAEAIIAAARLRMGR